MPATTTLRDLVLSSCVVGLGCKPPPSAALDLPAETPADAARAEPDPKAASAIPSTDVPACTLALDEDGVVQVGGQPTNVFVDPDMGARLRAFPWDQDSILVAIGMTSPAHYEEPEQIGTLYRVRCEHPSSWISMVHIDGADFAWAELAVDRRWLYFSYPGVGVLDFAAGDWARLAPPRIIDECWMMETPTEAEDYVFGRIADDALLLYTGGPCGFEAEWEGRTQVIDGIREGELPFRRNRAHVGTVTADSKGRIWVGDGGQCSEAEGLYSPAHSGLWRSDDAGESWTYVPITGPDLHDRGVAGLWIHASNPLHMLAQMECCYGSAADYCEGGELVLSEDGGSTWIEVSPRLSRPDPDEVGPVDQLAVDPVAWRIDVRVPSFDAELRLGTRNGGRTWQDLPADQAIAASAIPRAAQVGEWHFEPALEGLLRTRTSDPLDPGKVLLRPGP